MIMIMIIIFKYDCGEGKIKMLLLALWAYRIQTS